jgi:DNA-directed RNA polymerase II subunit RPB1
MNDDEMLEKNITMDDIHYTLTTMYKDEIDCVFSDYNDSNLVFRIRLHKMKSKATSNNNEPESLDQSDEIFMLKSFQSNLMENVVLRGVKNIKKVMMRKVQHVIRNDSAYENQDAWVLDTDGTNLQDVLGIEAARQSIFNELVDVIEFDSTYINSHHLNLLCDRMTYNTKMTSIFRHGINNDDIGPLAKASFEETPEMFLKAARHAELDIMKGVSANVMCGQEGNFGTSAFKVVVDEEAFANIEVDDTMMSLNQQLQSDIDDLDIVDEPSDDMCSLENIKIENNAKHIVQTSMGDDDESYMPDF